MASLYFHIPFCRHKCIYCSFFSTPLSYDKDLYTDCLIKELTLRKDFIDKNIETIYFGGGTPSLLPIKNVEKIFNCIERNFNISDVKEVTFEINPENADKNYLQSLKTVGINRLSIGIESFDKEDLRYLNRSHTSEESFMSVENALSVGYSNISIDLISNLPFSSFDKWKRNLDEFLKFDLPHISCYTLMIEEGTMLKKLVDKGKYSPVSEQRAVEEADYTIDTLESHGYKHYETSSFAKDGFVSMHNTAYWTFKPYLGVGAGAHSFDTLCRTWNENDIKAYTDRIISNQADAVFQKEILTAKDKYNEYVMLSARMSCGPDPAYVKKHFSQYYGHFVKQVNKLIAQNLLNKDCSLTRSGWHLQDALILELAV
ncbi:MAG: radical SAM family heme chaperone HemW [Bacteroidales bacterium]|nr:radical SAM family heme chaperone HemW [Bacteroidales bacterium]